MDLIEGLTLLNIAGALTGIFGALLVIILLLIARHGPNQKRK